MKALKENIMTFGVGPAGTGKTYLAVADAVENMSKGKSRKDYIIKACCRSRRTTRVFTWRFKEKIDPYLRPLYDALEDCMYKDKIAKLT